MEEEKNFKSKTMSKQFLILVSLCFVLIAIVLVTLNKTKNAEDNLSLGSANYAADRLAKQAEVLAKLPDRAQKADIVITGKILETKSTMEKNSYGDELIITHATVGVNEWLKGNSNKTVEVDIVGGTYNGLTLVVSTEPEPLKTGEYAVMFLTQKSDGRFRVTQSDMVSGAEHGIMKFTADGLVNEEDVSMDMDQVRSALNKK